MNIESLPEGIPTSTIIEHNIQAVTLSRDQSRIKE